MNLIKTAISKPVSVTVAVLLTVLFGVLALVSIPVQLTPNVDSTVITVSTSWLGASPQEIEQDIVQPQEERLKGIPNLKKMVSTSAEGSASVVLEFYVGTDKNIAIRDVSDKLREISEYPDNVTEPVVSASNRENRDYIAWIVFKSTDPSIDIRLFQDYAEDHVKPVLRRVPGVSEINVLGGRERELQVRFDPLRMAQRGVTYGDLANTLRDENVNISAGSLEEGKSSVRIRTVGQFQSPKEVEQAIIKETNGGPIRIGDVATAVLTYREPFSFVRSKGVTVLAINVQRETGTNVIQVMEGLKAAIDNLNAPGGILEAKARSLGLNGKLVLRQVYDQTTYIEMAINLVTTNIFVGGSLAVLTLLLFLRSFRSVGIIGLAIPVSVIGTFVAMVAMGRNLNVISLAGLAFAIGMVVDNSIVVLENIYRHLEFGETPARAAYLGAREVWGAVFASTLTTVAVFVPILFIEEEAGQLFRDIALAICAAVLLSLIVSITVIPSAAKRWLRISSKKTVVPSVSPSKAAANQNPIAGRGLGAMLGRFVYFTSGSVIARIVLVSVFAIISIAGSWYFMPPTDYLPNGNRNMIFGMIFSPPGYNINMMSTLGERTEETMRPFWEASADNITDPAAYEEAVSNLPAIPSRNPGETVVPPTIDNYFFVGFSGTMFHGASSEDPKRAADLQLLMSHATRSERMPGAFGFAFQMPLFNLSGVTGSSINIEFTGDDLDEVSKAAEGAFMRFAGEFGHRAVRPDPPNFNVPGPELQIIVNRERASDLGISTRDVGLAVRALSDGAVVGEYHLKGESIDLTILDGSSVSEDGTPVQRELFTLDNIPIATKSGKVIPLSSIAKLIRTTSPEQINHVEERRAVTLQFTPTRGQPLEDAMQSVQSLLDELRNDGTIPPTIDTQLAGSADKLTAVRAALLGDGSLLGTLSSRLFLALLVVYLLMAVLFESFVYPIVILLSVPLATLGGFISLRLVYIWTTNDPYLPVQNLDVLTMLGFVILIGVVVNNAILIVHQALNFMKGISESQSGLAEAMPQRVAIAESVRSRLRPILMSTLTSVGGMLPLILMPGSGSELYRGLGSVVVGGLLVSTVFTLILVPLLLSLVLDLQTALGRLKPQHDAAAH